MADRLPDITHLQFLVLGLIGEGESSGRTVRMALRGYGVRRSAPAFYQLMARLERDGLVHGRYHPIVVGDQTVNERRYRLTSVGETAWSRTRSFYAAVAASTLRRWSDA
jgi:DNA-binding PadR family transcriptional regulator